MAGRRGREPGGILGLVDLIAAHRGAFEYDWRSRFHVPLSVVGESMRWGEAVRLTRVLLADPSSQVGAAVGEWAYPMSREALILADLYDLEHFKGWDGKGRRPQPYPRPTQPKGKRTGTAVDLAEWRRMREEASRG